MLRAKQTDLENKQATPFTLLFAIYNAKLLFNMKAFETFDLVKQCNMLQPDKICDKDQRKTLLNWLVATDGGFADIREKSYLRIHLKYVLSMFHKETQKLLYKTNIEEWSHHEIILSFIHHLITESVNDKTENKKNTAAPKIWEFVDYLRKYFIDTSYDGKQFLSSFDNNDQNNNDNKPTKGFGLKMMKTVCSKYQLKSGPFSKVKKQCNAWAQNLHQQSQGVGLPQQPPAKPVKNDHSVPDKTKPNLSPEIMKHINSKPHNYSKFVTDVSMYVNPQQQPSSNVNQNDHLKNKKWYWFNDNPTLKWIPYRDVDVQKLHSAWRNKQKSCLIMNGDYRVDFDRSDPETPTGNQYNNRMQNPGGRTVICSEPKSTIHGVAVSQNPL